MLSVQEVSDRLGKPGVFIFDANTEETFLAGHVPGATHVQFNKFTQDALPKDKEATLIFYCKNPH